MTIDYRSPPVEPRRRWFSWTAAAVTALPLAVFYAVMTLVVPLMEKTYADFGVAMPGVTAAVINLSRWARQFGWTPIVVLPIFFGALIPLFVQPNPMRPPRSRLALPLLINAILMLVLVLMVIALIIPYYTMMNHLTKP